LFPRPSYPTPTLSFEASGSGAARLFVKNDGATHPVYGGNKVRKAERIVLRALEGGSERILTFGAAGSHHVLTIGLFARAHGLGAAAVMTPQMASPHVEATLRASVGAGVVIRPVAGILAALPDPLTMLKRGDLLVPPGGSSVDGALGYVAAVAEVAEDVKSGRMPEPDEIVVAVGSGGTAAGILAGVVRYGLGSRVVGVSVGHNPLSRELVLGLARRVLSLLDVPASGRDLRARMELDRSQIGGGYGHGTPAATEAAGSAARSVGLLLDATYTGKAFAAALERVRRLSPGRPRTVLYWHTLSSAPIEPLLEGAPSLADLPAPVRRLLRSR
jgi:1-aminocyclopropane-1-carboxylate deaminase/D-cysteine desulfhydrase-like pyridoxal-dependent ACC family enzyme